jgi:hypothetical protein
MWVAAGALAVLAIVYIDVQLRARSAYLEGEKYMDWYAHPEKKKAFYDDKLADGQKQLMREHDRKRLSDDDFSEKMSALQFDHDYALNESSLKYAYQWYKDAYELFSPPESRWVRLARAKAPVALSLWKQELHAQNIPFEDRNFD